MHVVETKFLKGLKRVQADFSTIFLAKLIQQFKISILHRVFYVVPFRTKKNHDLIAICVSREVRGTLIKIVIQLSAKQTSGLLNYLWTTRR